MFLLGFFFSPFPFFGKKARFIEILSLLQPEDKLWDLWGFPQGLRQAWMPPSLPPRVVSEGDAHNHRSWLKLPLEHKTSPWPSLRPSTWLVLPERMVPVTSGATEVAAPLTHWCDTPTETSASLPLLSINSPENLPGKSAKGFFDQAVTFTIQIEGDENRGSSAVELREMWLSGQACCYQPSAFPGHTKPGICISILRQASGRY